MRTRKLARAFGLLATLAVPSLTLAYQLDYHIEAGVEYNDNVNLSQDDPISANILEPKFGFNLQEQGSTVQANASGVLEYYDYLGGELADQFRSTLSARVNWTMVPERLNFTFEDYLGLEPINSLEANRQSNLQQTNVFGLGPTFDFRLGETVRGQADLRYLTSYAEETREFNTNRLGAALRAIKDLDPASAISANIEDEFVDFTDSGSAEPDYSRYSVFGRYTRKWAKLDLTADAGWSWINYRSNLIEDRDDPLARFKADWHVTERSTLTADAVYQYSDSASDMLTDMVISGAVPGSISAGSAVGTSEAYLEHALSVGYAYAGDRATFTVRPYYRKLNYIQLPLSPDLLGANQTARGALASFSWVLRPLLTASLGGSYENTRYDTVDREDKTWSVTALLSQQWTPHWSGQLSYTRYDRNSSAAGAGYDQNIVYFAVTYTR